MNRYDMGKSKTKWCTKDGCKALAHQGWDICKEHILLLALEDKIKASDIIIKAMDPASLREITPFDEIYLETMRRLQPYRVEPLREVHE